MDVGGATALIAVLGAVHYLALEPHGFDGIGGALGGKIGSFFDDTPMVRCSDFILALLVVGLDLARHMIHKEYFHATVEEIRNAE